MGKGVEIEALEFNWIGCSPSKNRHACSREKPIRLLSPLFAKPIAWRVLDVVIGLTMVALVVMLVTQAMQ